MLNNQLMQDSREQTIREESGGEIEKSNPIDLDNNNKQQQQQSNNDDVLVVNNVQSSQSSKSPPSDNDDNDEELDETTRNIIQQIKKLGEEPSSPTESPYIDFLVDCDCTVAGAALKSRMDIDDFLNVNPDYSLLDRLDEGTRVKIKNEKHFEQKQRREERKAQTISLMNQLEEGELKREERKREERKKKEDEERLANQETIRQQQAILQEIGRRGRASSTANRESHLTASAFNFADNVVESVGNTAVNIASGVASGVGTVTRASTNVVGHVASGVTTGVGTVASGVGSVAESVASGVASVGKGFWSMVGFRSRSGSNPHPFITDEVDVHGDHSSSPSPSISPPKHVTTSSSSAISTTNSQADRERTRGRSSSFLSILPFTGEVIDPYISPPQKSTNMTAKTVGTPPDDHNHHLSPKPSSPPVQQFYHHPKNLHHDMMMHFKTPQILEANNPIILKESQVRELSLSFPLRFRNKNLVLLYSTQEHGISLLTLYRKVTEQQPIIIIVETTHGEVFGAFLTCEIELTKRDKYYGDGESYVFKFDKPKEESEDHNKESVDHHDEDFVLVEHPLKENKPQPTIHTYKWMKTNEYFQLSSAKQLAVGGGGDGFAFTLDADLKYGSSHKSETYGNEPLTSVTDFQIYSVEVFTLETLTTHSSAHLTKHQSLKLIN